MADERQLHADKPKLSVFLSYSRKDNLSFADQIRKGLETFGGVDVLLDRTSIAGGEVWTARTQHLIESCDTILLAISPEAVESPVCNWEIDLALATKKRVFTVFNHDMPDAEVPERVRTINQIFFFEKAAVPGSGFATGLAELVALLKTDVAWVRKHSEVAAAAKRWDDNGRRTDDLYKGSQLEEVLKWRASRPTSNAPELTDLQVEFLNESDAQALVSKNAERLRNEKDRRRNSWIFWGVVAAGFVVISLGILAALQAGRNAENLGILFAELSQQAFEKSDYTSAMRWALAGLDTGGGEAFGPDSDLAELRMSDAKWRNHLEMRIDGGLCASFSPDSSRVIVTGADEQVTIWNLKSDLPPLQLKGHEDLFGSCSFSPNGELVVTDGSDGIARVWDARTGIIRFELKDHSKEINDARFSHDGLYIVTASNDGTAKIWDTDKGTLHATLNGHSREVTHAEFSRDGKNVVTGSNDGTARLWDARIGQEKKILAGHSGVVNSVRFSPSGASVVTTSGSVAILWDASSGAKLETLYGHLGTVYNAHFSPNGESVVTASADKTAKLWNVQNGKELVTLAGHADIVTDAQFSPNSEIVVTASWDKTAKLWDVQNRTEPTTLAGDNGWIYSASFSPDGKKVVTTSSDGNTNIWRVKSSSEPIKLIGHDDLIESVKYSRRGRFIVTTSRDKTAKVWNPRSGSILSTLFGHSEAVSAVAFTSDELTIVTASHDGTAKTWNAETGRNLHTLLGHSKRVNSAEVSPDDSSIVTSSDDGTAKIWDVGSGQLLKTLEGHTDEVNSARFSHNGKLVVTTSRDGRFILWDVRTGLKVADRKTFAGNALSAEFAENDDAVLVSSKFANRIWYLYEKRMPITLAGSGSDTPASYSRDFKKILVGSWSGEIAVYDAESGKKLSGRDEVDGGIRSLSFSPNSQFIVASFGQGAAILDSLSGDRRAILESKNRSVGSVQFSPDGLHVVTTTSDSMAKIWDVTVLVSGTRESRIEAGCDEIKVIGVPNFTDKEMTNRPILRSRAKTDNDPCHRKGLLNSAWWFGEAETALAPQ